MEGEDVFEGVGGCREGLSPVISRGVLPVLQDLEGGAEAGHVEVGVEGELGEASPGVLEVLLGAFPLLGFLPEEVGQFAGYRGRMMNQDQLGGFEELQKVLEMAEAHGARHA